MEYALWVKKSEINGLQPMSLNPYSNGICSLRRLDYVFDCNLLLVLILILMEYALWDNILTAARESKRS